MSDEKKKADNKRTIDPAALTVLDRNDGQIETAYDRYVKMQPQCNFGRTGVCCRICLQGPCRITKKSSKGICGAHGYTIAARNPVRATLAARRPCHQPVYDLHHCRASEGKVLTTASKIPTSCAGWRSASASL